MKKLHFNINLIVGLIFTGLMAGCAVEEDLTGPILGLEGDTWPKNEIDFWLEQNFLDPYNVEVKYRWDASELSLDRTLVPPQEERVQPIMEVVKEGWIEVYNQVADESFIKAYAPKQYLLVGSPQYNSNGTITVGQAEAGRKVVLFRVNQFEKSNRTMVKRTLKTIHHEFAHILHQTTMYPPEYKEITPGTYTSSWNTISEAAAREMGFITPYASSSPDEDFVEMIAIMLTEGKNGYEEIIAGIQNPQAVLDLRKKEDIVITYFKQVWNIEFSALQSSTEIAIEDISPTPVIPLHTLLGPEKPYNKITLQSADIADQSEAFIQVFEETDALLGTRNNAGRFIETIEFGFAEEGTLILTLVYKTPSNLASTFYADFAFDLEVAASGVAALTYLGPPAEAVTRNNNGRAVEDFVTPIMEYLDSNDFIIGWKGGRPVVGATENFGQMTTVNDDTNFFFGILSN